MQQVQIKQGQILVEENQLIDREVYRKLELTGLLSGANIFKPVGGLLLLIALFISALVYYFERQYSSRIPKNKSLMLFSLITAIVLIVMEVISLFQQLEIGHIGYLVPIAMGVMLIKLLINERLAILSSMILSICGSMMFNQGVTGTFNYGIGTYFLISSMAGILF